MVNSTPGVTGVTARSTVDTPDIAGCCSSVGADETVEIDAKWLINNVQSAGIKSFKFPFNV